MSVKSISMLLLISCLLLINLSGCANAEAENNPLLKQVATDNNEFAINMYKSLKGQKGNLFFSPYSISTAMAITYAGARENTEKQMSKVLNFTLPQTELHSAMAQLSSTLNKSKGAELSIANSLWIENSFKVSKTYIDLINKNYGPSINLVDFINSYKEARVKINLWVEQKTKGKIKDLIVPGLLNHLTRMVIVNAIYFKGKWENQFKKEYTQEQPFYISENKTVKMQLMVKTTMFKFASKQDFKVIELPYAGKELSMIIILPEKKEGLAALENNLTETNLKNWISNMKMLEVELYLPRFKYSSQFLLNDKLKAMGLTDAFDVKKANFSGIDPKNNIFISAIVHKAFVDVNEEGTEAAAATAVVAKARSVSMKQPEFKADHPFLYFIKHNPTGNILFMGRVLDPGK